MSLSNLPYQGAIVNPIYMPAVRDILSVTNAFPAVVTTTFDGTTPGAHGYLSGLIVRLVIPPNFGMRPPQTMNGTVARITVISDTTFEIALDTTNWGTFVVPALQPGNNGTPAQVVPVGEETSTLTSSFRNIQTPLY